MGDEKYAIMLELLTKAEMEARNGNWATVGTYCHQAELKAREFQAEAVAQQRHQP